MLPLNPLCWQSIVGALGVLLVGMGLNALGLLGGGDVKLLAVMTLWVGWPDLLEYLITVALAGGGLSLLWILMRRVGQMICSSTLMSWTKDLPYGVAIAATGILFILGKLSP
jgi:prepilin peptidase CpaA